MSNNFEGWIGHYVYKALMNGQPIKARHTRRQSHIHDTYRMVLGRPRLEFMAPHRENAPELVIIADGNKARLYNTVTHAISEPIPRALALQIVNGSGS